MNRNLRHPGIIAKLRRRNSKIGKLIREGRVEWGTASYGSPNILTFRFDKTKLVVGNYVSIAQGVTVVLGGNHKMSSASSFPLRQMLHLPGAGSDGYPWSKGDVIIGSDVWVGVGAIILSGVAIGEGSIVAAGSVVVADVEPYSIVGGNPARLIQKRFQEEQVSSLLAISWWFWPPELVRQRAADLCDLNIDDFIRKYYVAR